MSRQLQDRSIQVNGRSSESRQWIDRGLAKVSYAGPIPKGSPRPQVGFRSALYPRVIVSQLAERKLIKNLPR